MKHSLCYSLPGRSTGLLGLSVVNKESFAPGHKVDCEDWVHNLWLHPHSHLSNNENIVQMAHTKQINKKNLALLDCRIRDSDFL